MTPELHAAVMALTPAEKYQLIDDIQASIPDDHDEPWADALLAELERRTALSAADPSRLLTWEQVKANILARHAARHGR
jgi:putative addiction module component (TIGR02574 family)